MSSTLEKTSRYDSQPLLLIAQGCHFLDIEISLHEYCLNITAAEKEKAINMISPCSIIMFAIAHAHELLNLQIIDSEIEDRYIILNDVWPIMLYAVYYYIYTENDTTCVELALAHSNNKNQYKDSYS